MFKLFEIHLAHPDTIQTLTVEPFFTGDDAPAG